MRQIWTGRAAQTAAKYADHAPMAAVCCNACRTCATTNAASLGLAALLAAGAGVARAWGRLTRRALP